jgi:dsDNA-specific endonuclease/ATPase MutS2
MTLTLDVHPIFRSDRDVDRAVRAVIFQAARTNAEMVVIIPGKGSGKLRARVVALLRQAQLRRLYRAIEPDPDNTGRVLVRFR